MTQKYMTKRKLDSQASAKASESSIIELHESGSTSTQIASELSLSRYGVRWLLKTAGYNPRQVQLVPKQPPKDPDPETLAMIANREARLAAWQARRDMVRDMNSRGMPLNEIAKVLGCSRQAVQQLSDKMGLPKVRARRLAAVLRRQCQQCGAEFEYTSRMTYREQHYCSPECAEAYVPKTSRGTQRKSAKLTEAIVADMKRERAAGAKLRDLAAKHLVSIGLISHVISGRNWKHVS